MAVNVVAWTDPVRHSEWVSTKLVDRVLPLPLGEGTSTEPRDHVQ